MIRIENLIYPKSKSSESFKRKVDSTSASMVYLGVCDEAIESPCVSNITDSQLGGVPHWLTASSSVPVCARCGNTAYLVTQLYAPLLQSSHHRVLYLFACVEVSCQNESAAWFVVRALCEVRKEAVPVVMESGNSDLFADDWGVDGDDWGGGEEISGVLSNTTSTDQITQSISRLEVSEHCSDSRKEQGYDVFFPPFYLYVMEEPSVDTRSSEQKEYDIEELSEGGGGGGKEKYEKSEVKDKEFYKFYKKIKLCPEQCIRYDLGGTPLLLPPDTTISLASVN